RLDRKQLRDGGAAREDGEETPVRAGGRPDVERERDDPRSGDDADEKRRRERPEGPLAVARQRRRDPGGRDGHGARRVKIEGCCSSWPTARPCRLPRAASW